MAKVASEKKYSSFVKGLVTEASALTFPENASLDEDNFDLNIDGSRKRRLGIDYEAGYSLTNTGIPEATLEGTKKAAFRWDFPGGATDVVIGVVRAYNKLWFVNLLASSPSAALLNGGNPIIISGLANSEIDISVVNNFLILVSQDIPQPIVLDYNKSTTLVSQLEMPIQVRDTWGVNDGLNTSERPTTLTAAHKYNLMNQGWKDTISSTCGAGVVSSAVPASFGFFNLSNVFQQVGVPSAPVATSTAIACTFTTLGIYPSNADIWTLGKVGDTTSADFEKYSPASMTKNSVDNTEAPRGSFIIDAFKRGYSRYLLTGLTTLPVDEETGSATCVASYASRAWYSGVVSNINGGDIFSPNYSGYVFFSQIITSKDKLGKCYQEADPTSPTIPDIIDTDGGAIQLPTVSHVLALVPVKDSLLVFSENGVLEIYGDTGGFKATNYQTANVSSIGVSSRKSIVVAGNTVFYWAPAGIFMLSPDPSTGRYVSSSLTISTIQSYYNSLSDITKGNARGFFDAKENHIRWLYNNSTSYSSTVNVNSYTNQLNLDISLQAFYKFSISPLATNSPYVSDFIDIPLYSETTVNFDVYTGNDNVLVGTDQVVVEDTTASSRIDTYRLLTFVGTSFTLSRHNNTEFLDWKTADGIGVDFSSYLVTGYETFGDIMRNKQAPYIFFYLNRTEDGFTVDGNGNLIPNNPSSCMVQAQWSWANSAVGGRWGTPFQAYRYVRNYIPSGAGDTFDTGDSIIVTKNKLRGGGKALSLKIYSETGKDLYLLGWSQTITGDGTP